MFSAILFADSLSSTSFKYSSLNVNIAEGSIPTNGVMAVILSLNMLMFLVATSLACFSKPLDKKARPDSS